MGVQKGRTNALIAFFYGMLSALVRDIMTHTAHIILLVAWFVFAPVAICGAESDRIVKAVADSWPPYTDPQNPSGGLTLEIIRAAFATQGYSVTMTYRPWVRAELSAAEGAFDLLINCWITAERQTRFLFSAPYATNRLTLIKRTDDGFTYAGLESLIGKRVGTIRGYGYTDSFRQSRLFAREDANSLEDNIQKLIARRIDLTLEDQLVASAQLESIDPELRSQVAFVAPPLAIIGLHIAISRQLPRGQEYLNAFNAGLSQIRNSGAYAAILARYGARGDLQP